MERQRDKFCCWRERNKIDCKGMESEGNYRNNAGKRGGMAFSTIKEMAYPTSYCQPHVASVGKINPKCPRDDESRYWSSACLPEARDVTYSVCRGSWYSKQPTPLFKQRGPKRLRTDNAKSFATTAARTRSTSWSVRRLAQAVATSASSGEMYAVTKYTRASTGDERKFWPAIFGCVGYASISLYCKKERSG